MPVCLRKNYCTGLQLPLPEVEEHPWPQSKLEEFPLPSLQVPPAISVTVLPSLSTYWRGNVVHLPLPLPVVNENFLPLPQLIVILAVGTLFDGGIRLPLFEFGLAWETDEGSSTVLVVAAKPAWLIGNNPAIKKIKVIFIVLPLFRVDIKPV